MVRTRDDDCEKHWRFVCQENIVSFENQLSAEADPARRKLLETLIAREREKFESLKNVQRTD